MQAKKAKSRIDRFLCEQLNLNGVVKSDPNPVSISEGASYSLVLHRTGYNYYCDICSTKLPIQEAMYIIILNREVNVICREYECNITGNSIYCSNPEHIRSRDIRKDLAGIVCSEECYNMYVLRKEVV